MSKKQPEHCVICGPPKPLADGHKTLCADCLKAAREQAKKIRRDELIKISEEFLP